jgi:ABC-type amino acid transport system permease subunit
VRFWRLAAWAVSGVIYISHIAYEQFRLRNSRVATSVHAALAAALGGFLLAVGATVHAALTPTHAPYWRFRLALVVWPIITGVPAFFVALVITVVLGYVSKRRPAD